MRTQEDDDNMLRNYQEPTLERAFEDDCVVVVFKYDFNGNIGISYFDKLGDIATVCAICHEGRTIQNDETVTISPQTQRLIYLTLSEHDKNTVLTAAKEIMSWDDVLATEPKYIKSVAWDTINDPYFDDQASMQPFTGINVESAWVYEPENILVGVLDTGIDANHTDSASQIQI